MRDWIKEKENSQNIVWSQRNQRSTRLNVRKNANNGRWQVYVTDGMIEVEDLGNYNKKSDAIEVAMGFLRRFPHGL